MDEKSKETLKYFSITIILSFLFLSHLKTFLISTALAIYWIADKYVLSMLHDPEKYKSRRNLLIAILAISALVSETLILKYGTENIGGLFERNEYYHPYIVNISTEKSSQTTYQAKADVHAYFEEYAYEDNDDNVTKEWERIYSLTKVYLPNGTTISFGDTENESLRLGYKVQVFDDNGEDYWVELTKQKAK